MQKGRKNGRNVEGRKAGRKVERNVEIKEERNV